MKRSALRPLRLGVRFTPHSRSILLQSQHPFSPKAPCCSFARDEQQEQVEQQEQQTRTGQKSPEFCPPRRQRPERPQRLTSTPPDRTHELSPRQRVFHQRTEFRRQEPGDRSQEVFPLRALRLGVRSSPHSPFPIRQSDVSLLPPSRPLRPSVAFLVSPFQSHPSPLGVFVSWWLIPPASRRLRF